MPARVTTANKQDVLDFIAAILDEGQYQVVLPGGTEEIRIVPVRGAPPPTVTVTPDGDRAFLPPIPWLELNH